MRFVVFIATETGLIESATADESWFRYSLPFYSGNLVKQIEVPDNVTAQVLVNQYRYDFEVEDFVKYAPKKNSREQWDRNLKRFISRLPESLDFIQAINIAYLDGMFSLEPVFKNQSPKTSVPDKLIELGAKVTIQRKDNKKVLKELVLTTENKYSLYKFLVIDTNTYVKNELELVLSLEDNSLPEVSYEINYFKEIVTVALQDYVAKSFEALYTKDVQMEAQLAQACYEIAKKKLEGVEPNENAVIQFKLATYLRWQAKLENKTYEAYCQDLVANYGIPFREINLRIAKSEQLYRLPEINGTRKEALTKLKEIDKALESFTT